MSDSSAEKVGRGCKKQLEEWDKAKKRYDEISSKYAPPRTRDPRSEEIQLPGKVTDRKASAEIQKAQRDVDMAEQKYRECVKQLSTGE